MLENTVLFGDESRFSLQRGDYCVNHYNDYVIVHLVIFLRCVFVSSCFLICLCISESSQLNFPVQLFHGISLNFVFLTFASFMFSQSTVTVFENLLTYF